MPINYRYDEGANRLSTRCEGKVVLADVLEHFRQLRGDARLKPRCDVMLDLTFQERMPTPDKVERVAMMIEGDSDLLSFGRCAIVSSNDLGYGIGRLFQGFAWPSFAGVRVFRSEADAMAWLDEAV